MKIPSFVELTCKTVTELVTDYMDGELTAEDRVRFEQHLHACTWCMTYLTQMRRTAQWTSQLAAPNTDVSRAAALELFRRLKSEGEP
jgi:predicted anti-sigma-YlaC factor YlaD